MGTDVVELFNSVYPDGPSSSPTQPEKPRIRTEIGGGLQSIIDSIRSLIGTGIQWKDPVAVATTANITLSGEQTIDGVLTSASRVLVKNQSAPAANGIYLTGAGAWARTTDADNAAEVKGMAVFVRGGTAGKGKQFVCVASGIVILGTTALPFIELSDQTALNAALAVLQDEVETARGGEPSLAARFDVIEGDIDGLADSTTAADIALQGNIDELADTTAATDASLLSNSRLTDQNTWNSLGSLWAHNRPVVYDTGEIIGERPASVLSGLATPFVWDGAAFGVIRFPYVTNVMGALLRVRVYSGNQASVLAEGFAFTTPDYIAWVRLNRRVDTSVIAAGVLYATFDIPGGSAVFSGHVIPEFVDVPDPATYPQKYVLASNPQNDLADWISVDAPYTGFPVAFKLYDATMDKSWGPSADKLIVTPRHFGMVGMEMNVYPKSLRSGQSDREYSVQAAGAFGQLLSDRWTWTPDAAITDTPVRISCLDADYPDNVVGTGVYSVTVVDSDAAAGVTKKVLFAGDSLTDEGRMTQRALDNSAANPGSVQVELVGTVIDPGNSLNRHEGHDGWSFADFLGASSPFWNPGTSRFDASYYLTHNGFDAPDIIVWHLGINEIYEWVSDYQAFAGSVVEMERLDSLIGLKTGSYTPWNVAAPGALHLVCIPTAPAATQDGFGAAYGIAKTRQRYERNRTIFSDVMCAHYKNRESDNVLLVPFNAVVDPKYGFLIDQFNANANSDVLIDRINQSVHPINTPGKLGGYEQMGDCATAAINVAVARGWA